MAFIISMPGDSDAKKDLPFDWISYVSGPILSLSYWTTYMNKSKKE